MSAFTFDNAMTDADLDEHFPRATREQRLAIQAYHAAGWTIEPMLPNSDQVAIRQTAPCDCMNHAWINTNGRVISL